ncbi:hypothetical protein OIU84_014027 [Salix udensis]|uniref:Uncharacterized protein n=1 Tax=Salix udensis TaxID=889485 RepID=A0AAD6JCV4_9ROSI|nr:hypothetical protein OIU84_014027 [Salix udensis]
MASTVTPVLIQKEFVQCAESKYLTPSFINRAMHNTTEMLSGASGLSFITCWLVTASQLNCCYS